MLDAEALDAALTVAADFIDMKSPYMGGHSRRCAQLATDAARVLGQPDEAVAALRRAALVHDFGTTAVSNSIWDKPGPLTRAEFDRVELHTDADRADAAPLTGARRPEPGGVEPPREVRRVRLPHARPGRHRAIPAACVLAATEIYVGLTTERADRPPFSDADAAAELRRLEAEGLLEPRAARAVLVAAGHGEPAARMRKRPAEPGRAVPARGRRAAARRTRAHDARDRGSARHLAQDRRPPHPEHLHQDQRLDPGRRRALGDAARARRLGDGRPRIAAAGPRPPARPALVERRGLRRGGSAVCRPSAPEQVRRRADGVQADDTPGELAPLDARGGAPVQVALGGRDDPDGDRDAHRGDSPTSG